ncbi:MAG: alcohol dehydrogenase catalytic domain-containing protein, partial [Verrucomicrobia bacterium]|nr:alcohol dehydrogenase catalytic domain-containing protein [Verrucomicrobiota bacterium]
MHLHRDYPARAPKFDKLSGTEFCSLTLRKTVRAYFVQCPKGPFTHVEVTRPTPGCGQVLVRVHASGVNRLDTKIRAAKAAHAKQPIPAVLGLDMAGVVEELGPDV